jgi:hypothetical protein
MSRNKKATKQGRRKKIYATAPPTTNVAPPLVYIFFFLIWKKKKFKQKENEIKGKNKIIFLGFALAEFGFLTRLA